MIGVIVAGHGNLASEMITIAENIMGKQNHLIATSVKSGESQDILVERLSEILKNMETEDIIILSDIFGGSISNTCLYFAKKRKHVGVVTGVNLPMILKVLTHRDRKNLKELVSEACEGGKHGIQDICGLLNINN
ncbi:hypothetical protein GF312_22400 [Candidatus Poribacteria bacterium]|nr:hypothetical protein [Candidatus Poribacteria bacterium]